MVMPDMRQGYGFPIGGGAATASPHGVISPGAIGYDINCGVRLLASSLDLDEARDQFGVLADRLNAYCPRGVGKSGSLHVSASELDQILLQGAAWLRKRGLATEADLDATEDGGSIDRAPPRQVSSPAQTP